MTYQKELYGIYVINLFRLIKHLLIFENIVRDDAGYNLNYDEYKQLHLCRKSWEEDYNYLLLIALKREIEGDIVFVMKAKTHLQNAFPKRNFFG